MKNVSIPIIFNFENQFQFEILTDYERMGNKNNTNNDNNNNVNNNKNKKVASEVFGKFVSMDTGKVTNKDLKTIFIMLGESGRV